MTTELSIEDLAGDRWYWPMLATMIRSEQLSATRLAEIAAAYPEFWAWLEADR